MNGAAVPETAALTDSRLAALCAETVQRSFGEYETRFQGISRRARERFIARDWHGSFADASERLRLYSEILDELTQRVRETMADRLCDRSVWTAIKAVYSALIAQSLKREVAESFFNSLTRRVFVTEGVDQAIEFVDTDFDEAPAGAECQARRVYEAMPLTELIEEALAEFYSAELWAPSNAAIEEASRRIGHSLGRVIRLEVIGNVFYRGRGAYVVGRACGETAAVPVALCLRHETERGIELDALLFGETDLAILFSFTRAYFRVEVDCPYQLVRSLCELMPRKRLIDLYTAIGYQRHGKTEFYRDFIRHLRQSHEQFVAAEGARGMVMLVFTLPSYDVVFKLIKDHFDYPKESTRAEVMRRYRLVFEHDRAGRLVEAHEFEHLRIPRHRFAPELLDDLRREAGSIVREEGDDVMIAHAYVERRIRPLNLFLAEENAEAVKAAARDYGQSIKDLAVSNIFPGDLLTKNFGVTRSGRVVFYDYDELCFVTDCHFRDIPEPTTPEQEMAAEPWYSVRENDVFPEEFLNFLSLPGPARAALLDAHYDLFRASFWRKIQEHLRAGEIPRVFTYPPERRLTSGS